MSDSTTTALITGGFMLVVIVFNEIMFLLREKRIRKKEFFNQFFPERIKAHEEILRIMTKGGITGIIPKLDSEFTIKKKIKQLSDAALEAVAKSLLFADRHIGGMLFDLIKLANKVEIGPESDFTKSVTEFDAAYYDLLGALRKKSGVELIEEVFESIPQKRCDNAKTKKEKAPQTEADKKKE